MKNKGGILLLVVLLAGGGYYYYHTQLSSSFLSKKKMEVAGEERDVRSKEGLEKIGLTVRRIPNKDNAAILYVKASNVGEAPKGGLLEKVKYVTGNQWITSADFTRWFERNQECLSLVHRAARKPDCEFPVFGGDGDPAPSNISFPHLSPMRDFAFMLACEGKRFEYDGDCSRALDCYLAISTVGEHLHDSNAVLITDLVVIACNSIRDRTVEMSLAHNELGEADLRQVIEHYEDILDRYITLADCLKFEKALVGILTDAVTLDDEPVPADDEVGEYMARFADKLREQWERDYRVLKKWTELPAWQALRPENSWEAYANRLSETSIFSRQLLRTLGRAKKHYARSKAHAGGVLLFAAIKLYETKNGRPPAALGDLVPECVSKLPKDPFSGRDFIYKVRGNEWILYSVWDNLRDDGGAGTMPHDYKNDKDFVFWSKPIPIEPPPR